MRLEIILFVVIGVLLLGALRGGQGTGDPFPALSVTLLRNGEAWTEAEVRGHVTLVQVFASWCPHCAHDVGSLMELKRRYPSIRLVGILWNDSDKARITSFLEKYGNPYHSLWKDADSRLAGALRVSGVPLLLVVDHNGIIRGRFDGEIDTNAVGNIIETTLKQAP